MPIETTDKYIRLRQADPAGFMDGTLRVIVLDPNKGIKAIVGKKKGEDSMTMQSLLFDVNKWSEAEANKWAEDHGKKSYQLDTMPECQGEDMPDCKMSDCKNMAACKSKDKSYANITKTENGKEYPAGDFAYVPDAEKPSTWKLRLTSEPGGTPDSGTVGAAVAALGKGFRGNKVEIPAADVDGVLTKVKAAWKKANPDKTEADMPEIKYHSVPETYKISGYNIFSAGKWNGDTYTEADLDNMVKAYNELSAKPPLKLGHTDNQKMLQEDGLPAAGWITNLYREGKKLYADFSDIPKKIYDLIQAKAYRPVSAEIMWNYQNGKYPRVLKAVALLGADFPAVTNLDGILSLYAAVDEDGMTKKYNYNGENDNKMSEAELKKYQDELAAKDVALKSKDAEIEAAKKEKTDIEAKLYALDIENKKKGIEAEVDKLITDKVAIPAEKDALLYMLSAAEGIEAKKYSVDGKELTVKETILKVFSNRVNNPAIKALFTEQAKNSADRQHEDPSAEVADRAKKYADTHKVSYSIAQEAVLTADPVLKAEYLKTKGVN